MRGVPTYRRLVQSTYVALLIVVAWNSLSVQVPVVRVAMPQRAVGSAGTVTAVPWQLWRRSQPPSAVGGAAAEPSRGNLALLAMCIACGAATIALVAVCWTVGKRRRHMPGLLRASDDEAHERALAGYPDDFESEGDDDTYLSRQVTRRRRRAARSTVCWAAAAALVLTAAALPPNDLEALAAALAPAPGWVCVHCGGGGSGKGSTLEVSGGLLVTKLRALPACVLVTLGRGVREDAEWRHRP